MLSDWVVACPDKLQPREMFQRTVEPMVGTAMTRLVTS